jgi:hypothetical protein
MPNQQAKSDKTTASLFLYQDRLLFNILKQFSLTSHACFYTHPFATVLNSQAAKPHILSKYSWYIVTAQSYETRFLFVKQLIFNHKLLILNNACL